VSRLALLAAAALAAALPPAAALAAPPAAAAPAVPTAERLPAMKAELAASVDQRRKLGQEIVDSVFSFGELGFQEVETSKYLTAVLEKNGFTVKRGVGGLPTGWTATWGSGGPVIALGSDIDGLPKASQKPGVAHREPLVAGAPGHGEGHNSGQAVNILAALALKDLMQKEHIPGTLVLWPGVAEELVAGKAFMIRDGVFKGVDAVVFTHVGDNLETAWGPYKGSGLVSVKYSFHGESAHAAGAPWLGRSALDGAMLMGMGWDMRREHLRPQQRSHYVITDGGDQPNVVPPEATIWFFVRETDFSHIAQNYETANTIAEAAAKMSNTTVTRQVIGSAAPRYFNKPLAELMDANIRQVGLPTWTADEQAFAKAVQRTIHAKEDGLATQLSPLAGPNVDPAGGGGSDDVGDISWTLPTVMLVYPSNIPNLPGHNWVNAMSMATPIAHDGVVAGGKVVAMTVLDMLTNPAALDAAKSFFRDVQTKDEHYVPMIGPDDKPQIQLNADIMAKYRPEMRKYYYDPKRYKTYLDQLGVKWPTF
jgi:aminobenzoyl-glutamate utilization protein B